MNIKNVTLNTRRKGFHINFSKISIRNGNSLSKLYTQGVSESSTKNQ